MASLIQVMAVAEHLNFRHAANALGVSLSNVSARAKTLEEDLGILLYERNARGVRLTEILAGETGQPISDPVRLIVPMLERFIATERGFAKARRK
ncbi:LysR family transcriptional regulator [Bradyrhizobium sp. 142]|uniref:LysR family transcriptional regulator n=1 Tax=Bradyrhizobium sp. 142 TaxID=2782618 RepID=UPI0023EE3FD3|nr:LysR family transcriptional regulator [Bradyrhizobium sp. 142]MCK1727303.1 LysR family transcriptional regulator [Bradyrhizobium sp. 142]